MSGFVLALRARPPQRLDLAGLTPATLAGMAPAAVAALPLFCGNRRETVGDHFDVRPEGQNRIVFRDSCDRLDGIGADLAGGSVIVEGDAGAYLGRGMRAGTIAVTGSAGVLAGNGLKGGTIVIDGDTGDFLAGAAPGEAAGMQGGMVVVRGRAGHRAGDRLRRGVVVVEGDLGDYAGSRMIAGTLIGLGDTPAVCPGHAMRRGTILLAAEPRPTPAFADAGPHDLGFVRLLYGALDALSPAMRRRLDNTVRFRRRSGDLAFGGRGEILVAASR
jgi:formylmethanofuran dehydrogenase subunit C